MILRQAQDLAARKDKRMSPNAYPFESRQKKRDTPDLDGVWEIIAWQEGYRSVQEFAANDPENYMKIVEEVSERFGIDTGKTEYETI